MKATVVESAWLKVGLISKIGNAQRWNQLTVFLTFNIVKSVAKRDKKNDAILHLPSAFNSSPVLPANAAGFKKGERPGENAGDTKTMPKGERAQLIIRNCIFGGRKQPGQISLMAALTLKENIDATVENCVFLDNEVAFRLRGPTSRKGAWVRIDRCAIYQTQVGVRAEDTIAKPQD